MTTVATPPADPLGESRLTRASLLLALLVVAGGGLAFHWLHGRFALDADDAYVTYRYASNLAQGLGFTYNAGERVLGTTTPLYTLLLAGCGWLQLDIARSSAWINVGCAALTLGLVHLWLSWRTGRWYAGLLGVAVLLGFAEFVLSASSGMETSLYLLLIVVTFLLHDRGWLKCASIAAGACLLVRVEGAAVGAALVLHHLCAHRRLPTYGVVLCFLMTVLPWVGFALWYFGDVRPQSMLAAPAAAPVANRFWMMAFLGSPMVVVFWPLVLLGWARALQVARAFPGIAALALWGSSYAIACTACQLDPQRWPLAPMALVIAVLAVAGLVTALNALLRLWPAFERRGTLVPSIVAIAALAPILGLRGVVMWAPLQDAIQRSNDLEQARADAAAHIVANKAAGDVVVAAAIGIVGWRTGLPMHDTLGRVTRDAVGKPLDVTLQEAKARWVITETRTRDEVAPTLAGYRLVGRFARQQDSALLLFDAKAEAAAAPAVPEQPK